MEYKLNATQMRGVIVGLSLADEYISGLISDLTAMVSKSAPVLTHPKLLLNGSAAKAVPKPAAQKPEANPVKRIKIQPAFKKSERHPYGCKFGCKLFYATKAGRDTHQRRTHKPAEAAS